MIISVLPKGSSFTANAGTKVAVLSKGRSSTANSGTKVVILLRINSCGSFPLLFAPRSLFSIWTDLRRSIQGAPALSWVECSWIIGPSGLHRNSSQWLNIGSVRVFDQIRDPKISITLRLHSWTISYDNLLISGLYIYWCVLAALAQMVACLPLVQRVRGSIPSGVVYFHLKIFNLGARRGGDVHFLIARLYITSLD